jgi:hypothetical protein
MKKTVLSSAILVVLGVSGLAASVSAQAAVVNTGDTLTINSGVPVYDSYGNRTNVTSGSWFGMDTDKNGKMAGTEKTPVSQGTTGLVIGVATPVGTYHAGDPVVGDTNAITAPWSFFGNTGSDYTTVPITGSTETGLNFSGWTVAWNTLAAIPMGSGAWGTGYTNGVARFVWDGVYGHTYTLDYHGTVPLGDPSNFGGVQYALHLEGVVNPVPIPAAVWLLGSGLLGLVGVARRRKTTV